jgi:hypothetical protein
MRALLRECSDRLGHAVDAFPWSDRRAYGDWLAQTYFYVRHSTRLLAAAAARFPHDERGDALHSRFAAHMAEEKRHELLCVHDLKGIASSLAEHPERHGTRMFYEPQYYKIEHHSPIALFGYILPLEAIGPWHGRRIVDALVVAHGAKSVSFLKLHAAEDVEHLDKAIQSLEGLETRDREQVMENMLQTTHAYVAMLAEIRGGADVRA